MPFTVQLHAHCMCVIKKVSKKKFYFNFYLDLKPSEIQSFSLYYTVIWENMQNFFRSKLNPI